MSFKPQFEIEFQGDERTSKLSILSELSKDIICPFCCLRFMNWQNISLCASPIDTIIDTLKSLCETYNYDKNSQCVTCLNTLIYVSQPEFKQEVLQKILNSGFEYSSYLLTITTPVYLLVSDAIYVDRLNKLGVITESDCKQNPYGSHRAKKQIMEQVIPSKKLAKFILGPYLTPLLGVPVSFASPFRCEIDIKIDRTLNLPAEFKQNLQKAARREFSKVQKAEGSPDSILNNELSRMINECADLQLLQNMLSAEPAKVTTVSELIIYREVTYLCGRYLKLQRGIAQTGDMDEASDEEPGQVLDYSIENVLEAELKKHVHFEKMILTAAGREDIDVRMLGTGRPFILQLIGSKNCPSRDWVQICSDMNKNLGVEGHVQLYPELVLFEKGNNAAMQELYKGSTEKVKNYRAVLYSAEKITLEKLEAQLKEIIDLQLSQKTPIRVLHRRPLIDRQKTIFKIDLLKFLNEHYFVVEIKASAGCYIKEFVHGDFSRTVPNLSGIVGVELQIVQLDVMGVEQVWPVTLE
ncbi:TRNA_pseudouridine synthase [Hexamita inflata]|uniref:tRNA pseudouridine(55) synthase n=1 Tax=Hexamita inflata TaxID=28002 RepID=A0AA86UWS8_9EUKA|nr:TRNA pseudouridine synthase [Hexamita inflata]